MNRLTFLLQAWRKYDTDRSGYIEANELKVGWALPGRVWKGGAWARGPSGGGLKEPGEGGDVG